MKCFLICFFVFFSFLSCQTTYSPTLPLTDDEREVLSDLADVLREDDVLEIPHVVYDTSDWYDQYGDSVVVNRSGTDVTRGRYSEYTINPRDEIYERGAVVYNYVPDQYYQVFVCPYYLTSLYLEPGEFLISDGSVYGGNTHDFQLEHSFFVSEGQRTNVVHIKPISAGKRTNIVLPTNYRIYHILLYSYNDTFMPVVRFRYPLDGFNSSGFAGVGGESGYFLSADLASVDFDYSILYTSPNPPKWNPTVAFTDGQRTYIQFPSPFGVSVTPVLYAGDISEGRDTLRIYDYSVRGDFYIVNAALDFFTLFENEEDYVVFVRNR